ncbi:MAG: pilus assembly protein TadD, partial [Pseudomonadota bacterium]
MQKRLLSNSSSLVAISLALSVVLASCAKDPTKTGSIRSLNKPIEHMTVQELRTTTARIGERYKRKPRDRNVGLQYADILRATGRNEQALAVMQQVVIHHPEDNEVLSAYGKSLAASGNFEKLVVHGHTPTDSVHRDNRRIGLDTGAYMTGRLSAARFLNED